MQQVFTAKEVAAALGVTLGLVRQWKHRGYLVPMHKKGPALYSRGEVLKMAVMAAITEVFDSPFRFVGAQENEITQFAACFDRPGLPLVNVVLKSPVLDVHLKPEIVKQIEERIKTANERYLSVEK